MSDLPAEEVSQGELLRRRRRRLARAAGLVVALVAVVWFVVDNSQPVKVRFWLVTAHPRLIWVVLVCLVAGALLGFVLGRERRRRRARRRGLLHRDHNRDRG